jgi:hypothetical protein
MTRHGPPNESGPGSEAKLRKAGQHPHTRSDNGRASPRSPIYAALFGSDCCTAAGISVRGYAPVLGLCRALIEARYNSQRALHAYRDGILALVVRSIGEGSRLTVEDDSHGRPRLRRWRKRLAGCGAASLVRQTEQPEPSGPQAEKQTKRP